MKPTCRDCTERETSVKGRCTRCYQRAVRAGVIRPRPSNRSGRVKMSHGYIRVFRPSHPLASADGYVLEHRLVAWEQGWLTEVNRGAVVHHRNGVKDDNRPENLEVVGSQSVHMASHVAPGVVIVNQHGKWAVGSEDQRCSIDGCNLRTDSRGWCSAHYTRWVRLGDPLAVRRVSVATVSPYTLI